MYNPSTQGIIIFIAGVTFLLLLFISFIVTIVYKYQQKQNLYYKELESLKTKHHNLLLQSQLEMQEQTFQNISREIHDNIGQKLTLAKLHLNTLDLSDNNSSLIQVNDSVEMISEAIKDLSDISRSMSSEIILNNGLIRALEFETEQLHKSGRYVITLSISSNTAFLEANKELVLFRIVQEALNNIVKHAEATTITIKLHYHSNLLNLVIIDNGKGFSNNGDIQNGAGLINMKKRAHTLNGKCIINSKTGGGTAIKIEIPIT